MSLTIELNPEEQSRLAAAAKHEGIAPEELARKVLTAHLPPTAEHGDQEDPTLALFRQWAEEDVKRTPEEAKRENEFWEQFQTSVNETREALGMRKL